MAEVSIEVHAPVGDVWDALVNPDKIKQYMFGTTVVSDWQIGSPIVWRGEWQGKSYEDKGRILELKPERLLSYDHFSPLTGQPDVLENYHTVTIELSADSPQTIVTLTQNNNPSTEAQQHSEQNWNTMLTGLKKFIEE